MVFLVLCDFFGQIHSTSLNFNLQIGLWAKKHLVFVFVSILMTMSYMSLEIFSFEWIQILNGRKVWQYHRLSHHKIWATSIHISFFEFHTNIYLYIFAKIYYLFDFVCWHFLYPQVLGMTLGGTIMLLIALYEHDMKNIFHPGTENHSH